MALPVPILLYHTVDDSFTRAYARWAVTPARFDAQMSWLKQAGYTPLTISDLVAGFSGLTPLPANPVAVTFDDGLRDFLTGALPILERHDVPATLYIVTGRIGATSDWLADLGEGGRAMLSWDEVRAIDDAGIECGAHTISHPELDILPLARAAEEIQTSKAELEDALQHDVASFAYPHGYASRRTRRLVREAGFTSACRVRHALSALSEDRFALSRVIMTEDIDGAEMERLFGDPSTLPVAPPVDRLLAQPWRMARRIRRLMHPPVREA